MANNKIPSLGFHHIALRVKDFEQERKFFEEGLGLTPYAAWGSGDKRALLMELGNGGMAELFAGGSEETEKGNRYIHFAFSVDDVEAAFARAIAAGASEISAPKIHAIPSAPVALTLQCAFVRTPGGAEVEFIRTLRAETKG